MFKMDYIHMKGCVPLRRAWIELSDLVSVFRPSISYESYERKISIL